MSLGTIYRLRYQPGPFAGTSHLEQQLDDALGVLVGTLVIGTDHHHYI